MEIIKQNELVLAVQRDALRVIGVGNEGIYKANIDQIDQQAYAFLPRAIADNKKADGITLGHMFPQILGYFQIYDPQGRILVYRRKGKEEGLLGKYSIGVGGHVDVEDLHYFQQTRNFNAGSRQMDITVHVHCRATMMDIVRTGAARELREELGLNINPSTMVFDRVISTFEDTTSTVHVGLPMDIKLIDIHTHDKPTLSALDVPPCIQSIVLSEDEFLAAQWLTIDELKDLSKQEGVEFETWSRLLIEQM